MSTVLPFGRRRRGIPPPFPAARMIRAALKRESRLDAEDRADLLRLARRSPQGLSVAERWALCDIGDRLLLGAWDR